MCNLVLHVPHPWEALIKDEEVIEKILRHLDVWDPPRGPPFELEHKETVYDYSFFDNVPPNEVTD